MRRGELLGLTWDRIDLDAARVTVWNTTTEVNGQVVTSDWTKTDAGQRTIGLDDRTVATLKAWKRRQTEERLAAGPAWVDAGGAVATMPDGSGMRPSYLSRQFLKHCRTLGLPEVGVHGLRHTYATASLRAGVSPEVVSKRLGHADVGVTLSIYAHALEGDDQAAAARAAAAIDGV